MVIADYIIVGSGCTGAIIANTICGNGKQVLMIDAGLQKDTKAFPSMDFITRRQQDEAQGDYFLGEKFEVLQKSNTRNLPQQTAQRKFMTDGTNDWLSVSTKTFDPVESLAYGGLGNGWGLGSNVFSSQELRKCGLPVSEMEKAYREVGDMIGLSGENNDDAATYSHNNKVSLQPATKLNEASQHFYDGYIKKRNRFQSQQLYMGRPVMALLTEEKDARKPYSYSDTDFYENEGQSAYRPELTVSKLISDGKLQYAGGWLVLRYEEGMDSIAVYCKNISTQEERVFHGKQLVLAAGALGTARIVLRSNESTQKLPVICNAYTYMPMLYWPFLGKSNLSAMSGLSQLTFYYDKLKDHSEVAMASIYNYRSLLNFRILEQLPFNAADGNKLLKLMSSALFIAGLFHPETYAEGNYIALQPSNGLTGDTLETHYVFSDKGAEERLRTEKIFSRSFRQLNCTVLKKIRTAAGASIHYGGTLPFSETEKAFSISPEGKLHSSKNVFVADGSGFTYLPGKGLTFSLMAFANHVGKKLLQHA